ncbi:MAG TPA: hypothetical protein VMU83_05840 [Hanamia sp.]|nr:hypothetical protein [Hanamia sp.]
MFLNIIHLAQRVDRLQLLKDEIATQKISNFKMWEGVVDNTLTRRGISRAHKNIIRHAKLQGSQSVLIGEDDLHFTAPGAFNFYLANIPDDFDIYLGGIVYGNIDENNLTTDFSGTTLYIIHERFYDQMLALPEDQHIDRALRNCGKFVVCNPMAVIPHNGYSDNRKRYVDYEPYFNGKNLFNG